MIRGTVILAALFTCGLASSAEPADARAIIDQGIKALGGADKLAKFKGQTWKEKGTYYGMGEGLPYAGVNALQWPDQFKMEIVGVFTMVVNGDKGWTKMGETKEMTKEQLAEQKESLYAGWVGSLLPLQDKKFTLTALPAIKIDGKPAVGVKVASAGHRDVTLWFDQATHLLVKQDFKTKAEDLGGAEVQMENILGDYQEVEGIKIPMKILIKRDGKKFVEAENYEVKPVAKLADDVFAKP